MESSGPWIARNQMFARAEVASYFGMCLIWFSVKMRCVVLFGFFFSQIGLEKVEPVRQTNVGAARPEHSCASGRGKVQLSWVPGVILFKTILRILVV